jgi:tetratricopeptide (TPR) repeat protein
MQKLPELVSGLQIWAYTVPEAELVSCLDPEKAIGNARVMQRVNNNFFINNLVHPGLRSPHGAAIRVVPQLSAAAIVEGTVSASRQLLATYIELGEGAQAQRNADALRLVGDSILEMPLDGAHSLIGRYYQALSINRQGPQAYPKANKLLLEVADNAPAIFRAKARVALGTNAINQGDREAAESLYAEAAEILSSCKHGVLHPAFFIRIQRAFIKVAVGDHDGALEDLNKLLPLAQLVGQQYPALLQIYYNNLALRFIQEGRVSEADSLCRIIGQSPFGNVYPDWKDTCALLESKRQQQAGQAFTIGSPFTRRQFSAFLNRPIVMRQPPANVFVLPDKGVPVIAPEEGSPAASHRQRGQVLDFTNWISRKYPKRLRLAPKIKLTRDRIREMTTQQKQAAIVKLVLSADIKDPELERVLNTLCEETPQPAS